MKKIVFYLLFVIVLACDVVAQAGVMRSVPTLSGSRSIVRRWTDTSSVAYVQTATWQGCFVLESDRLGSVLLASAPNVQIFDYKIIGDELFFCGTTHNQGAEYAIVGFFDIPDVFYNHGLCYYGTIDSVGNAPMGYCRMSRPYRMDAYYYNGVPHIVAVGFEELDPTPGVVQRTTILDAYYDAGANAWYGSVLYNKDGHEYYTDITATESYVVAAANAVSGIKASYLQLFHKSPNILQTEVNPYNMLQVVDGSPWSEVLVEAMRADTFAVAYYLNVGSRDCHTLKVLDVTTAGPYFAHLDYSLLLPQGSPATPSANWLLRDLAYNDADGYLALLQDRDNPISGLLSSVVGEFRHGTAPASTTTHLHWIDGMTLFSLDRYRPLWTVEAGIDANNVFSIFKKQVFANHGCCKSTTDNYVPNTQAVSLRLQGVNEIPVYPKIIPNAYQPLITKVAINTDCQR